MLEATGFEDNVPLFDACVALCWHRDVCSHPPLHPSPLSPPDCQDVKQTGQSVTEVFGHILSAGLFGEMVVRVMLPKTVIDHKDKTP